jgi:hypothetical protein
VADDIVTRLDCAYPRHGTTDCELCTFCLAKAEIERLRGIAEELADAFQQVTDHGDACPICWESFKATRKAENCYGHAAIIGLEARRG